MNWYIGPWIWDAKRASWNPPAGFLAFDLRSIESQAKAGGVPGLGLFAGNATLSRDYQFVKDQRHLMESLFATADPDGHESPRPVMPTTQRRLEFMGTRQRFQWGDCRTNRIRDVLYRQFSERWEVNQVHARKCLDYDCHKLGIKDWRQLVPLKLLPHVEGPLPHETTYTENFNGADSTTVMGHQLTWTAAAATFGNYSNTGYKASGTGYEGCRADHDLSSADHYSQITLANPGGAVANTAFTFNGPAARFSSSANTAYHTSNYSGQQYITKVVAGTSTNLANASSTFGSTDTYKVEANGSTIKGYVNGVEVVSVTDTSITGNTRCGVNATTANVCWDAFECSDLSAGGGVFDHMYFYRQIAGLMV